MLVGWGGIDSDGDDAMKHRVAFWASGSDVMQECRHRAFETHVTRASSALRAAIAASVRWLGLGLNIPLKRLRNK